MGPFDGPFSVNRFLQKTSLLMETQQAGLFLKIRNQHGSACVTYLEITERVV